MIERTEKRGRAVRGTSAEVQVRDPQSGREHVLLRAADYRRLVYDVLQDLMNRAIPVPAETRRRIDDSLKQALGLG